jgi:uncharacterized membrane protein
MVLLGLMVRLPFNVILITGLIIVFGHNLLDIPESAAGFQAGFWWNLLHHGFFAAYPISKSHVLLIIYPFVPWVGLMMLGYCSGVFFSQKFTVEQRRKILNRIGISLLVLFIVIRFINGYGNPEPWHVQKNGLFTLLSFINVQKYPPSLLYMCITIGPAFLLLSLFEKIKNGFTAAIKIYGRVPFFYYVIHLYVIHMISAAFVFIKGHSFAEATTTNGDLPFYFLAAKDGYSLLVTYIVWLSVVVALFPLCKWYNNYKTNYKEKWWLSYL